MYLAMNITKQQYECAEPMQIDLIMKKSPIIYT